MMALQKSYVPFVVMIATFAIVGTTVFAALNASQTISTTGTVKGVGIGVYKDSACTQELASIDWGPLAPGSSINKTAYIRNEGNTILVLSKAVSNWSPTSASSYMTLIWNRDGYDLNPGSSVSVSLKLTVSSSVTGISSFTFDITITGTEHP